MAYRRDHPGLVTKVHIWADVRCPESSALRWGMTLCGRERRHGGRLGVDPHAQLANRFALLVNLAIDAQMVQPEPGRQAADARAGDYYLHACPRAGRPRLLW
jgi:hypothetical protein